jgi:hypothetical protein
MASNQTSGTVHVYSTLSAPQHYQNYGDSPNDMKPHDGDGVRINGGSNIAHQDRASGVYTPLGVRTEVTADQLAYLRQNKLFLDHEKRGHIKVMDKKMDGEKAAGDMETRDKSAPLVPQDFEEGKEPTAGGKGQKKQD